MALPYQSRSRSTLARPIDERAYKRDIAALERLPIWHGRDRALPLWSHQQEAVALATAYLRAPQKAGVPEAALLKMPTGSGKSGVVALIARALPDVRKVLVLTPREGLVTQMIEDISWRFWRTMGLTDQEDGLWSGDGITEARVVKLLPNEDDAQRVRTAALDDRAIVVGTLQALDQLRVKHQTILRRISIGEAKANDPDTLVWITALLDTLAGFDAVVVDEGHYEPAPSWSRSVRSLERPTILLSATPFRNDYKLFSVRGAFAYNLPFPEARSALIVRDIGFVHAGVASSPLGAERGSGDDDTKAETVVTASEQSTIDAFAQRVVTHGAALFASFAALPKAKMIVRAAAYEHLVQLQEAIAGASGETVVLVHDRVATDKTVDRTKPHVPRFVQVRDALKKHRDARYWLHQTKLLEGIDDSDFVGVALYEEFANARQLVQQIGRILRSSDPRRREDQRATLIARDAAAAARIEMSWRQYLAFEAAGAGNLANIIPGEAYLPQKILPQMPEWQYVDGEFRERLPPDVELGKDDVLLPQRAVVFEPTAGFSWEILRTEAEEGILAQNRFVVRPIQGLPKHCLGWSFFTVDESPYLTRHFVTEWRFGLCVIAQIGSRLFVFDSDGVPFDLGKAAVERLSRQDLSRLFRDTSIGETVRITRMSASSLDMSARAIRTVTTSTASFAETFTDLLEPVLLPTNVAGYVGGTGRYLGLTRAKVSDVTTERVPIDAWLAWAERIEAELSSGKAASAVFRRFVQTATPDPAKAARPASILLDLEPMEEFSQFLNERGAQPAAGPGIDLLNLCSDVGTKGEFKVTTPAGDEIEARVEYLPKSGRYRVISEALDKAAGNPRSTNSIPQTLTQKINTAQAFRILTEEADKIYMHGEWVRARDLVVNDEVLPLIGSSSVPALQQAILEKGESAWSANDLPTWHQTSIFGLTKHYMDRGLPNRDAYAQALDDFPLVLLDDDGTEICDFVLVSDRKVVLLHAKATGASNSEGSKRAVSALQEVGRQAIASLAFFNTPYVSIADGRWSRPYTANKTPMPSVSRIFRNDDAIPAADIAAHVRRALVDPTRSKEVWIVLGKLINLADVETRAKQTPIPTQIRQLLMFIESLRTACGRANADLRIFG